MSGSHNQPKPESETDTSATTEAHKYPLTLMRQLELLRAGNVTLYRQLHVMGDVLNAVGKVVGQIYTQQQLTEELQALKSIP